MPMPKKPKDEFKVLLSVRVLPAVEKEVVTKAKRKGISKSQMGGKLIEQGLIYQQILEGQNGTLK